MPRTTHVDFLGRSARTGDWAERSRGTYTVLAEALERGQWEDADELLEVTLLEAEELRDVYSVWPQAIAAWLTSQGVDADRLAARVAELRSVIGGEGAGDVLAGWDQYVDLTHRAQALVRQASPRAVVAVEDARRSWEATHDRGVDDVYGMLSIAVELLGEECLRDLWDHLMSDWYDDHARRLDPANQSWRTSREQLALAITDGFHAHLSGRNRLGDMELIEEPDRVGFRFAPCGSGGRVLRDDAAGGARPEAPFGFAVTERAHPWAFGLVGVGAYCVHCCLLNMTVPVERIGFPTRVIEPPTWPDSREGGTCTWWVYDDPASVPADVVGRVSDPGRAEDEEDA